MAETLKDFMPFEFMGCEYETSKARKFADVEVISAHKNDSTWPGNQRYVYHWVELANGYIVGWNENPSRGWSFPVMKAKK